VDVLQSAADQPLVEADPVPRLLLDSRHLGDEPAAITEKIIGLDARAVDQRVAAVHGFESLALLFFARVAREISERHRRSLMTSFS
jgi:hypothetical protein